MNKVVVGIISRQNSNSETEWLLVSSAKDFGEYTGFYYPPGGHMEEGETETDTLLREIKEELGLDARPLEKITTSKGDVSDQETSWWKCEVSGVMKLDPELSDAQYFTKQQIEKDLKVWPATIDFFNNHIFNDPT